MTDTIIDVKKHYKETFEYVSSKVNHYLNDYNLVAWTQWYLYIDEWWMFWLPNCIISIKPLNLEHHELVWVMEYQYVRKYILWLFSMWIMQWYNVKNFADNFFTYKCE